MCFILLCCSYFVFIIETQAKRQNYCLGISKEEILNCYYSWHKQTKRKQLSDILILTVIYLLHKVEKSVLKVKTLLLWIYGHKNTAVLNKYKTPTGFLVQ